RRFCTLHGNVLCCYASRPDYEDGEEAETTYHALEAKTWKDEMGKSNSRGLVLHCEDGKVVVARADTAAEQEEWLEAME
ncbi:unnamed protein product, partial [Phaeothamnion confervicola]